jgi:CelD/BcsL family acetyltransferase involved in cellulose biosynthesis
VTFGPSGRAAAKARQDDGISTRVIDDEPGWDAIKRKWNDLYECSPAASPPLGFDWLRSWWDVYRPTLRAPSLRIITLWRGPHLVAALPLYVHLSPHLGLRRVGFISTGEAEFEETCPDYLNLLSLPGEEGRCAALMWRAIQGLSWDHLQLNNLAADTALLRQGISPPDAEPFSKTTCPVANLSGGFEAYLQRLSSNGRQQARRLLREGARAGASLELAASHQGGDAFNDLTRLHQARWNLEDRPGVFAAHRFAEFHRRLIANWLPAGRVVLARLSLASRPVAALYGFVTGSKFDFYQSGVDIGAASLLRSPGNLAHLLLMKALAERRFDSYDFLAGTAPYKMRLATAENQLVSVRIWRRTIRSASYRSAQLAARILRIGFRSARKESRLLLP